MEGYRARKRNKRHINDNGTAVSSWYVVYGSPKEYQRCLFTYLVVQLSLFNVDTYFTRDVSFLEVKQSGCEKITVHVIPIEFSGANYGSVALSLFKPVSQPI